MNVDELKEQALSIVAEAMQDQDLPAAKRADMALALLGKAALKESDQPTDEATDITITFRIVDDENEIERTQYTTRKIDTESDSF